ncbi:NifB/NifX family molybdenum-iron cluster-binding protein [Chloroflexota bacterium]
MKIAISMKSPDLEGEIEPRFGRCRYFITVNPETLEFKVISNSSADASGGAGVSSAQMISERGVEAVLTGSCGPNAHEVLSAAGIKIITGVSGKVRDAIEAYKSGKYQSSTEPNADAKAGVNTSATTRRGMGLRRGMGQGMGRGRGMNRSSNTTG